MPHAHMSLRAPQGRSNLLNGKVASSHWRAPRNDMIEGAYLRRHKQSLRTPNPLSYNPKITSCELQARRKLKIRRNVFILFSRSYIKFMTYDHLE
jgi:hypothetical protein